MKDMNPSNMANWRVVCSACGADFAVDETINLADGHTQREHPDLENPHFNIVWVGVGRPPKGSPKSHPGPRPRRRRRRR